MVITDLEITQASMELIGAFVSVMLAVIILINGHRQKSMRLIQHMFFVAALDFVADALAYIFRGNVDTFSLFMTRFSNISVFFLNFTLAVLSVQYIYSLLEEKKAAPGAGYRNIVLACFWLAMGLLVLNLFTGWLYYFDEKNYYHRNVGWYFYTMLSVVCILVSCAMAIRFREHISKLSLFSVLLFELFPLIAIVIQSMIYGISITNLGIGLSIILLLVTYLIDWNRDETEERTMRQLRRSYETIVLFLIMVVSVSASIVTCVLSIRQISADISVSNSQVVAHIVEDGLDNIFLRPITVTETMAKDNVFQGYIRRSTPEDPQEVEADMAAHLESIRTGFGYQMVYVVCEDSKTYYTYNGIAKTVDPENDPADAWYGNFVSAGSHYLLEVDTDEVNNWELSVFINMEVRSADGQFLGVCGVGLEMSELQAQLEKFEQEYNLQITLADRNGVVQVATDATRIERETLAVPLLTDDSAAFRYEELDGTSRLTGFMEDLGWYLVIEDLQPNKVDIVKILLPNVGIFLVGLFMLAVAFAVIMIRERKIARELIEKRQTSLSDELTGLKNRRAFDADCARIAEENNAAEIIAIMIDLNGLKEVNDSLGHQAGDELITATAQCLRQTMGQYGNLYRIGGDEFFAMLHCSREQLDKVLGSFESQTGNWNGSLIHSISTAKGVAVGAEHPEMSIEELVELADRLMYEDKNEYYRRTGKDRRRHRTR